MDLPLKFTDKQIIKKNVKISGSKSESNRLLILKQWFPGLLLDNISDSDDTKHLKQALLTNEKLIDIGHAGTAMRFLTAYFSTIEGRETVLTGSERMQNRPIALLVDALRLIGANIEYVNKEGYPPLRIRGQEMINKKVQIAGNVSSQYISALILIAPSLKQGLEIELLNEITSRPYLEMTLSLLNEIGVEYKWEGAIIKIYPTKKIEDKEIVIESDWSSASYFYSLIALSEIGAEVSLSSYKKNSLQGDSCLETLYEKFGVKTSFSKNMITIKKIANHKEHVEFDLRDAPDIAQTIAVTCFGLQMSCSLTGLHTLKIKETDRLVALQTELQKLGAKIEVTDNSLYLEATSTMTRNISIETYNDHRMAMAFAPLGVKVALTIIDANVVTKSYVKFWDDFNNVLE